tara:strand:- start:41 stop:241 length:201 start_codon:yes stop_codon:yes gene_type:complete
MQKVYILKLSEDGIAGIYTSKKRAIRDAVEYCGEGCSQEINQYHSYFYGEESSAEIELQYLLRGEG